jgi:hypothetical protein
MMAPDPLMQRLEEGSPLFRAVSQLLEPFPASVQGWIFLSEKSTRRQRILKTVTAEPL